MRLLLLLFFLITTLSPTLAQKPPKFKVIAFFTGKNDEAHVSFVNEANSWFPKIAKKHHFSYDTTSNWNNLNDQYLAKYQVVLFLDTRPEKTAQRLAFEKFIKNGGAWLGFHFAAFSLQNSGYTNNWTWYHDEFLGAGQYVGNTWRPTAAVLQVEKQKHPIFKNLPKTFTSQPNEWYKWEHDLRKNQNIDILVSIHPASFPLGTGPKKHEIWHEGYYPVAWSNKNFNMIYVNMGHNDMDYEHKYNTFTSAISQTFENKEQQKFIINSLLWLGKNNKYGKSTKSN
jgi:hypothetical protein